MVDTDHLFPARVASLASLAAATARGKNMVKKAASAVFDGSGGEPRSRCSRGRRVTATDPFAGIPRR